jgi:lysylphosphatidylglycerol synthetase-like protein (DUF2156 family)
MNNKTLIRNSAAFVCLFSIMGLTLFFLKNGIQLNKMVVMNIIVILITLVNTVIYTKKMHKN